MIKDGIQITSEIQSLWAEPECLTIVLHTELHICAHGHVNLCTQERTHARTHARTYTLLTGTQEVLFTIIICGAIVRIIARTVHVHVEVALLRVSVVRKESLVWERKEVW